MHLTGDSGWFCFLLKDSKIMKMTDIKAIAKERGIKVEKMNKETLIKTIQLKEGNVACYKTITACNQQDCCWRQSCLLTPPKR